MMYFIFFLCIVIVLLLYYLYKFALTIIEMQDVLNESLDLIDNKYRNISKILETPIFYDSTEVKRILKELEDVKVLILYIANKLANSLNKKEINDE
jgi:hypothetical protein